MPNKAAIRQLPQLNKKTKTKNDILGLEVLISIGAGRLLLVLRRPAVF